MQRTMLKAKLHRINVTEANLQYMGSITIDEDIMETAGILEYEKVQVVNINNGHRFETYVIAGERGSGTVCLNGAAARLAQPGDKIIVMSYVRLEKEELEDWQPEILFFDENNEMSDNSER
ncbi:MAG: aspartate 1-decarboxylase [Halanaerobiales bacterium]